MADVAYDFDYSGPTQIEAPGHQPGPETRGYVFDIQKYAIHDGPGIRTAVFFKGCPLRCGWCHNPESWRGYPELGLRKGRCVRCGRCVDACKKGAISLTEEGPVTDANKCKVCGECAAACLSGAREIVGRQMSVGEVVEEVEKDAVFYDESGGGVTFSGGEPLMQPQFLLALLDQCRSRGIHTAVETTCYGEPQIVHKVAERTDLFLCDLKHTNGTIHKRFTGVDNSLILCNIRHLSDAGKRIIIRIPIIPGVNDDRANIEQTAEFVKSLTGVERIDILPYNSGGKEKSVRLTPEIDLMEAQAPSDEKMLTIGDTLKECGFQVKIGG